MDIRASISLAVTEAVLVVSLWAVSEPNNRHWNRQAKTFEDPDGYRVVLARYAWR